MLVYYAVLSSTIRDHVRARESVRPFAFRSGGQFMSEYNCKMVLHTVPRTTTALSDYASSKTFRPNEANPSSSTQSQRRRVAHTHTHTVWGLYCICAHNFPGTWTTAATRRRTSTTNIAEISYSMRTIDGWSSGRAPACVTAFQRMCVGVPGDSAI